MAMRLAGDGFATANRIAVHSSSKKLVMSRTLLQPPEAQKFGNTATDIRNIGFGKFGAILEKIHPKYILDVNLIGLRPLRGRKPIKFVWST